MTQEQFNTEIEVIQKPRIAAIPFLWGVLKGWVFKNWESILILLLKLALSKYKGTKLGALIRQILNELQK